MRAKGHPVMAGIAGFFFGLFLSLLLLSASALALDSVLLAVFPILFLVLGIIWGIWAPIGRGAAPVAAPSGPPLPQGFDQSGGSGPPV